MFDDLVHRLRLPIALGMTYSGEAFLYSQIFEELSYLFTIERFPIIKA